MYNKYFYEKNISNINYKGNYMDRNVCVLLSTYNGEKYLKQQIESVLNQEDVGVTLFIRDDGSSDNTVNIIKSYKDERIIFCPENNIGCIKSFYSLLLNAPDLNYFAFCDQDDIWNKDKLARAINKLSNSGDKAALYMSTYDVVDENLKLIYVRDMQYEKPLTLEQTIMFRSPSGCLMVFNKALRKIIIKHDMKNARMHDFWTLLVAEAFQADIYTESISTMKYRQHANNVVGTGISKYQHLMRLINSIKYNKNERQNQVISFVDYFKEDLPKDSLDILLKVYHYKESFKNRIALATDSSFKWGFMIDILFFLSVITGVF